MMSTLPNGLFEQLAAQIVAPLIPNGELPARLDLLAGRLGVKRIERCPMVEDGSTIWDSDGSITIRLRSDRPHARQRFTLAHELGHVILARPMTRDKVRFRYGRELEIPVEERLCNAIAASILMPRTSMLADCDEDPTFKRLFASMEKFDVSLSALVRRWREISGTRLSVLQVTQRRSGAWAVVDVVGDRLDLAGETCDALSELRVGAEVRVRGAFLVREQPERLDCRLFKRSRTTAMVLASRRLRRPIERSGVVTGLRVRSAD